ncbi:hypothetical protein Tco_0052986 [Tanacetum coccineum]
MHGLYVTIVCYVLLAFMVWIVVLERDRLMAFMDLFGSKRDRLITDSEPEIVYGVGAEAGHVIRTTIGGRNSQSKQAPPIFSNKLVMESGAIILLVTLILVFGGARIII